MVGLLGIGKVSLVIDEGLEGRIKSHFGGGCGDRGGGFWAIDGTSASFGVGISHGVDGVEDDASAVVKDGNI
jgi:hypothetical protein